MENLNLSYREVYEDLPYLLLLLMSADKPRAVYEDKEKKRSNKNVGEGSYETEKRRVAKMKIFAIYINGIASPIKI